MGGLPRGRYRPQADLARSSPRSASQTRRPARTRCHRLHLLASPNAANPIPRLHQRVRPPVRLLPDRGPRKCTLQLLLHLEPFPEQGSPTHRALRPAFSLRSLGRHRSQLPPLETGHAVGLRTSRGNTPRPCDRPPAVLRAPGKGRVLGGRLLRPPPRARPFLGLGPEGPPARPPAWRTKLEEWLARILQYLPVEHPRLWEDLLRAHYVRGLHRGWRQRAHCSKEGDPS